MRSFRAAVTSLSLLLALSASAQGPFPPFPDTPINPNQPGPPVILTPNPDYPVLGYGELFIRDAFHSCQELKEACAEVSSDLLFDSALYGWLPVGLCSIDDLPPLGTDPNPYFQLGQTWRPGGHALPWGLGIYHYDSTTVQSARQQAADRLKQMCVEGRCCCPVLAEEECANKAPVTAYDPETGACCQYPNRCSMPEGWKFEPPFPGSNRDGRCN
jgi:hypothetical protein